MGYACENIPSPDYKETPVVIPGRIGKSAGFSDSDPESTVYQLITMA